MEKIRFLVAFISLISFFSLQANAKEEWMKCKAQDDCVLAEGPCGYASAVNKKYSKNFTDNSKHAACDKVTNFNSSRASSTAKCVQDTCSTYKKIEDKTKRSCSKDAECTFGIEGCWQWVAINKTFVTKETMFQGGHQIIDANVDCAASTILGPQPKAVGHDNSCE